jgi:hypothetical protein
MMSTVFWDVTPILFTLIMEALSVLTRATRRNSPEDGTLQVYMRSEIQAVLEAGL